MSSGPLFLEAFFTRAFTQHLLFSLVPALGPFLLAAAGATALTPLAMLLARRLGVVALPGGRHIHLRPTPLLGGWALYLAFAGAVAWYLGVSDWKIVGLLSLCGVATLLFTYDDRFRMAAPAKLAVEIGLGLVAVFVFGFNISFFTLPGGHVIQLGLVSDGGDPEAKVSADLGAVVLNRAARPLVGPELRTVHPDLARNEVDHAIMQI